MKKKILFFILSILFCTESGFAPLKLSGNSVHKHSTFKPVPPERAPSVSTQYNLSETLATPEEFHDKLKALLCSEQNTLFSENFLQKLLQSKTHFSKETAHLITKADRQRRAEILTELSGIALSYIPGLHLVQSLKDGLGV
jgi:hypothetical protein